MLNFEEFVDEVAPCIMQADPSIARVPGQPTWTKAGSALTINASKDGCSVQLAGKLDVNGNERPYYPQVIYPLDGFSAKACAQEMMDAFTAKYS
jgi:hypothetical protein